MTLHIYIGVTRWFWWMGRKDDEGRKEGETRQWRIWRHIIASHWFIHGGHWNAGKVLCNATPTCGTTLDILFPIGGKVIEDMVCSMTWARCKYMSNVHWLSVSKPIASKEFSKRNNMEKKITPYTKIKMKTQFCFCPLLWYNIHKNRINWKIWRQF